MRGPLRCHRRDRDVAGRHARAGGGLRVYDSPLNWCIASTSYNGTDQGSPGAPNPRCDQRLPQLGDVLFDEIMPDPAPTLLDQDAEWMELRNATTDTIDFSACGVNSPGNPNFPLTGIALAPGQFALVVRSASTSVNGRLIADATFGFSLFNSGGVVQLVCFGVVVDDFIYSNPGAGRTWMLDSDGTPCAAPGGVPAYFPSNFGTPGALNSPPECP